MSESSKKAQEARSAVQSQKALESRVQALQKDLEAARESAEERVLQCERTFGRERVAFEKEVASLQQQLKDANAELQTARVAILEHDRRTIETLATLKDAVVEQVTLQFKRQAEGLVAAKPAV